MILYRLSSGKLYELRIVNDGPLTAAVSVMDRNVIRNAVDSQQPGADVVADGASVHVLFIEEPSRGIFSTFDAGSWQASTLRVDNILES